MHGGVGHGAQVDPEAELITSEILGQGHVGPATSVRFEVTSQFLPHVAAADAFVVHPVGHAVDRNLHFGYVGVEVVLRIPVSGCVGADEEEQDALERPALGVHPKVEVGVRVSGDGHYLFAHDEVVRELLAGSICAHRLVGQGLTPYDFVLPLDVFQLVPEHVATCLPFHDCVRGGEGQLEDQVIIQGLRVEDAVVGKDVVVQVNPILGPIDSIQGVFFSATLVVFLSPELERILHRSTLWMPSESMLSLSSLERKRSSKVL